MNNLWQGKIIAKMEFDLLDETPLSFEYDLRFNKWRLLYRSFQWTGGAFPDEAAVRSFMKTKTCQDFIQKCSDGLQIWITEKDKIKEAIGLVEDSENGKSVKLAKTVLDDLEDIKSTFS